MKTRRTFATVSRCIFLRIAIFQIELVQKLKTHILFSIIFSSENIIMWKIWQIRSEHSDNITQHMRYPYWITKATYTHSEYVILVVYPWRQWFREGVPTLRHTYLLCPSCFVVLLCQPSLFSTGAAKNIRSSYFRETRRHNEVKDRVSAPVGLWNEFISNSTFIIYNRITVYIQGVSWL